MLDSPVTQRPPVVGPAPAPASEAADALVRWLQSRRVLASHEQVLLVRLVGLQGTSLAPTTAELADIRRDRITTQQPRRSR